MTNNYKLSENIYIIAEIGNNHNGCMDMAFKLIDEAKKAGCNCVKFQSWDRALFSDGVYERNSFLTDGRELDGNLEDQIKKYAMSFENLQKLREYCYNIDIDFSSSVFSIEQCKQLIKINPNFIKLASMDLNNDFMIKEAASHNLPVVMSTGLSSFDEIEHAVKTFEASKNKKLIILHCKGVYPPSDNKTDLNNIDLLKNKFSYSVGFSDHSLGNDFAIAAFAKGAEVFEKHFTLDKKLDGWDHKISADPQEMKSIVSSARRIEKALGKMERTVFDEEIEMRKAFRRSIVAKTNLSSGEIITLNKLDFKRPGTGISPNDYHKLINKKLKINLKKDDLLKLDHLCEDRIEK